jgi:hypothetical protein
VFLLIHLSSFIVLLFAILVQASCNSRRTSRIEDAPIVTSASYQHTLYNGRHQQIEARTEKNDAILEVMYFDSLEELEKNKAGTLAAPSEVGDYFARVSRPAGKGYAEGPPVTVEWHIQKAFIEIRADAKQTAIYDGTRKSIEASAEPPVPLDVSYRKIEGAAPSREGSSRPPVEPGDYLVTVSFSGNNNYRPAERLIEFSIVRNE